MSLSTPLQARPAKSIPQPGKPTAHSTPQPGKRRPGRPARVPREPQPAAQQGAGEIEARPIPAPNPAPKPFRLSRAACRRAASAFKVLGDPTRLEILTLLEPGPVHVAGLLTILSRAPRSGKSAPTPDRGYSQPGLSHHLATLRAAGLVDRSRAGQRVEYRLTDRGRGLLGAARLAV